MLSSFFQESIMNVRINGTLVVKVINGANGKFCVGDLNTPLGEFKVKEPILDQFEEGRYEGEFLIERFYLSSYVWRGKSTTDIRAQVTEVFLDTVDEGKVEDAQSEPDPLMTDAGRSVANEQSFGATPIPATVVDETGNQDAVFLRYVELFGAELGELVWDCKQVKLDPTVGREQFREQRDMLKTLGYIFDAKSQVWVSKE
jgi:hypothetical protein